MHATRLDHNQSQTQPTRLTSTLTLPPIQPHTKRTSKQTLLQALDSPQLAGVHDALGGHTKGACQLYKVWVHVRLLAAHLVVALLRAVRAVRV